MTEPVVEIMIESMASDWSRVITLSKYLASDWLTCGWDYTSYDGVALEEKEEDGEEFDHDKFSSQTLQLSESMCNLKINSWIVLAILHSKMSIFL